jgi:uncharacterized protein (DUF1330 family)
MTYYSVLEVSPRNTDWIEAYLPVANRLIAQHGAKYLARTAAHETIEGVAKDVALRIIIEWPSKEAATAFEEDPGYKPHLEERLANSESHHVLIAGQDDLA